MILSFSSHENNRNHDAVTKSNIVYQKGDVVDAPFPYQEDPDEEKYRPVLLLAPRLTKGWICCFITKNPHQQESITINTRDFKEGNLTYDPSFVIPSILYTLNSESIRNKYGALKDQKVDEVIQSLVSLLQQPPQAPPSSKAWERPKKPY